MIGGIKTRSDGDYCAYCDSKVNLSEQNFCSKCGNPLNEEGRALRQEQLVSMQLQLLGDLASKIKDTSALKVIKDKIEEL